MKTLFIYRHAKSSWSDTTLNDYDRPLNKRGKHDALLMAEFLAKEGFAPDFILCSGAKRTRHTLKPLIKALNLPKKKIYYTDTIYEASLGDLFEAIGSVDNSFESLLIVAHNPSLGFLLDHLVIDHGVENIVTGGFATLLFPIDKWSDIAKTKGKLLSFEYPKKHYEITSP